MFCFSMEETKRAILAEQKTRAQLAHKQSDEAKLEAESAPPEERESTLAEARERYRDALNAQQEIDHTLAQPRTWDEI